MAPSPCSVSMESLASEEGAADCCVAKNLGCGSATSSAAEVPADTYPTTEASESVDTTSLGDDVMAKDHGIAHGRPMTSASQADSFSDSAGLAEAEQGQGMPTHGPSELQTKESFQKRAVAMFLGGGGTPKATDIGVAFEQSTDGCIILAFEAAQWLFDVKKSGHGIAKVQASAGEIDRKEAAAYLINDALGRPIIEREVPRAGWPRKVGEVISVRYPKAKEELAEKPKAAAKAAAKGGEEAKQKAREAARSAAMYAPYALALPAAPHKRKAKAAAPPAKRPTWWTDMMKFWTDELKESTAELAAASGELLPMERDIKRNEAKLRDFDPEKMKMPSKPEALPAWVPSCTVDDARRQIELRREHEARMERWKMAVEAQIKELDAWRALSMQTKELILLKLPTLKRRVRVSTDRIEEAEEAIKDLTENPWLIKERREALAEAPGVPEVAVGATTRRVQPPVPVWPWSA